MNKAIIHRTLFLAVCLLLLSFACSSVPVTTSPTDTSTPLPSDTPAPTATVTALPSATPTIDIPHTETAIAAQCAAVPADLVGWWTGNGNAQDRVAGNDGVLHGGADFTVGKVGESFRFDGKDGSVDIPRVASLDVGRQVSVELWLKPAPDNPMDSCCQGLVGTDYYLMEFSGGRSNHIGVNFVVNTGGGFHHTSDKNNAAFQVPAGEWSFIVGTYDGQRLRLYVNGKEELQLEHPGRIIPMLRNSFLSIGSEDGRTDCPTCIRTRYFKGLIDEVSIYKRALTSEEIQSIFSAGEAGKCILP